MSKGANYACRNCSATYSKWTGKCEKCGEWNSIEDSSFQSAHGPGPAARRGKDIPLGALTGADSPLERMLSGNAELDQVLGGGLVPGSAILVGGDPGIGKSTLLLQAAAAFASSGLTAVYISGEEAADQVRIRAARLGLSEAPVALAAETNLRDIITTLEGAKAHLVIIDSIQTMWADTVDSSPGSVSQVRASAHELVSFAKRSGTAVILVGHVTKDGQIAGPRVVEHMVDTVLYFEGERTHQFRILRARKNRYGPVDEIGVFEMTGKGLKIVENPSVLFLSERDENASGSVVFAGIEGSRPLLVEIQALVAPSSLGTPRRAVVGWDNARLAMILAVLEARCGVNLGAHDVHLNIAGGLRITEPAADLAVTAALLSSWANKIIPPQTAFFGELSLTGAIRPVMQTDSRMKEAVKLGFNSIFGPDKVRPEALVGSGYRAIGTLQELVDRFK